MQLSNLNAELLLILPETRAFELFIGSWKYKATLAGIAPATFCAKYWGVQSEYASRAIIFKQMCG
jgi:hypothetical protein